MGYFATFLILHLHFRHKFAPRGYWLVDQVFRALVYSALIAWAMVVAYSRYGAFCRLIYLILTFPEVSPILSFGLADTLGHVPWHQLRIQLLRCYGAYSDSETRLIAWESTSLPLEERRIHMVANTRRLGSVA
jgi:hypothetical protein